MTLDSKSTKGDGDVKDSKEKGDKKKRGGHAPSRKEQNRGKTVKVKRKNEESCRTVNAKPLRIEKTRVVE